MAAIFDFQFTWSILPALLFASINTIVITLIGFSIALVLGLFLAVMRRSHGRLLAWPATLLIGLNPLY